MSNPGDFTSSSGLTLNLETTNWDSVFQVHDHRLVAHALVEMGRAMERADRDQELDRVRVSGAPEYLVVYLLGEGYARVLDETTGFSSDYEEAAPINSGHGAVAQKFFEMRRESKMAHIPPGRYFDGTYEWDYEGENEWVPLRAPQGMPSMPDLSKLQRVVVSYEPLDGDD